MDSESVLETGTAIVPFEVALDRIVLVCGLPSSLTYFVADLVRDMLARAHGACEVISLNDFADANFKRLTAVEGWAIGLVEVPDAGVAQFAREGRFPIFLVTEPFSDACWDFMSARDALLYDTVRTMARAQIALKQLSAVLRTKFLCPKKSEQADELVAPLADSLNLNECHRSSIILDRKLDRPLIDVLDTHFVHQKLDLEESSKNVLKSLGNFYDSVENKSALNLEVPRDMLLEADPPHYSASETIAFLGPARCLTFGPYLYLPSGHWKCILKFRSYKNNSRNLIGVDIVADNEIKVDQTLEIHQDGLFCFECEFQLFDPLYPFELRIFLRNGAIDGSFLIESLVFECSIIKMV